MLAKSKEEMIKESMQAHYNQLNTIEKTLVDQQLITLVGDGCFIPTAKVFRAERLQNRNKAKARKRKRKRKRK